MTRNKKNSVLNREHQKEALERLQWATTASADSVVRKLSSEKGLDDFQVDLCRKQFGNNLVTHEDKDTLLKRLAKAFINPFTTILIVLALVSTAMDIIIPLYNAHQEIIDGRAQFEELQKIENVETLSKDDLLEAISQQSQLEILDREQKNEIITALHEKKDVDDATFQTEDVDPLTVIIIMAMVLISGLLRFIQETRSGRAAEHLTKMIRTMVTVERAGYGRTSIPLEDVVVGDKIYLAAGDMVPADLRVTRAKDLFISQSALTGESDPQEKQIESKYVVDILESTCLAFMGSNVISGSGEGVVVAVGDDTIFGNMAKSIVGKSVQTSFEKGVNSVSWVLIRFMLCMVPVVLFINGFTKGDWLEAFLFGLSIAVGLTPEMLPMIVTTCLAKGAVSMSKQKTIIKNLNSIQNFGAFDVLCTDKTGTLTQDKVVLEYHMDVHGKEDVNVLKCAFLNSFYQTGLKNLMDIAIINRTQEAEQGESELSNLSTRYRKIDEIPWDFARRRMSVVVTDQQGETQIITKGAVEEMLSVCTNVQFHGITQVLTAELRKEVLKVVDRFNDDGMRVIAVAQKKSNLKPGAFLIADESEMTLIGYLAFLDPPKISTPKALKALRDHGVDTKVLTGDNERVASCICKQVGLRVDNIKLGSDIDNATDEELQNIVETTNVFAKLSPAQKERIVKTLRSNGHTVGFMGDGINDAAAMKASDVGISVDTAVDIAKESADVILLEKDLMVLENGIIEGRKTYANMIKYIKMTASSNFGNMFSVLAASAFLPFLPMLPMHLIFLNLIYDISCTAIPWDNVDEEFLIKPRKWDASSVGSFMIWIGPTSSIFDWTTYIFMYFVFSPLFVAQKMPVDGLPLFPLWSDLPNFYSGEALAKAQQYYAGIFQAGWFVESMWSQTLVIHMIRTPKIPFIQSCASFQLTTLTMTGIGLLTIIPFTAFGTRLGMYPLSGGYFVYLFFCILLYMALATCLKKAYVKHYGDLL